MNKIIYRVPCLCLLMSNAGTLKTSQYDIKPQVGHIAIVLVCAICAGVSLGKVLPPVKRKSPPNSQSASNSTANLQPPSNNSTSGLKPIYNVSIDEVIKSMKDNIATIKKKNPPNHEIRNGCQQQALKDSNGQIKPILEQLSKTSVNIYLPNKTEEACDTLPMLPAKMPQTVATSMIKNITTPIDNNGNMLLLHNLSNIIGVQILLNLITDQKFNCMSNVYTPCIVDDHLHIKRGQELVCILSFANVGKPSTRLSLSTFYNLLIEHPAGVKNQCFGDFTLTLNGIKYIINKNTQSQKIEILSSK